MRAIGRLPLDLGLGRDNGLLFWVHVVWGLGFAVQSQVWTLYIERLGASPFQIGLVVGGGAVVRTLLALPAGWLADHVSPKRILLVTMAVPVAGAVLLVAATNWWHALIAAALLDFAGIAIPALSAYIAAAAPAEQRTRAYTYIFSISTSAGLVVGPATGGWLAQLTGFRAVFVLSAALFAGGALLLAGLTDRRPARGGEEGEGPSGYRSLLRMRGVVLMLAFHTLVPLLVFAGTTLLPNFLEDERGLSVGAIGTLGSLGSAAGFAFGLLVSHWKPLGRPFLGMGASLGLVSLAFVLFLSTEALPFLALGYMLRMCLGPIWSLMAAGVAEVTPEPMRGRAYGLCELGVGAGDIGGPLLAGALYDRDPHLPMAVALAATAPLAATALGVHRTRGRAAVPAVSTAH